MYGRRENIISAGRRTVVLLGIMAVVLAGCGRADVPAKEQAQVQNQVESQAQNQVESQAQAQVQEQTQTQTQVTTASSDTTLTVTAIKAGAADAFVLISGDHVAIIDTGLDKKVDRLLDFLDEQGVTRVDEMIITHFDKDHVGGADHVIEKYEVGKIYTTYQSKDSDDITSFRNAMAAKGLTETVVRKEISFNAGDISFTIYPPKAPGYMRKTSNNSSLVIKVALGESSMLFAGDAEEERIEELLVTKDIQADVLKVPHHGRIADNSEEFIDYVAPKYAIITSGKSDPEDKEILDILKKKGIETFLTREGAVTIKMTADEITVTQ